MVYKFITLCAKKEGMMASEFKDHMERIFVPLMKKLCGPVFPLTYTRHYVAHEGGDSVRKAGALGLPSLLVGRQEDLGWDCLSELAFEDELHFQQYFSRINEPDAGDALLAEESQFSDITKLKFIVMEHESDKNEYRTVKDQDTWSE